MLLRLFQEGVLARADPGAGRFRSLLLAVARHVLLAHRERAQAGKRGGGRAPVPLTPALEPPAPAEQAAFDREWLLVLIERALTRLAREHPNYHAAVRRRLECGQGAAAAPSPDLEPATARAHLHRARRTLLRYLREEVWRYSLDPADHETELRFLGGLLGASPGGP